MSDELLTKLYEICEGDYRIVSRYKVGAAVHISKYQTDDIVDDLASMGLIKKIGESKILLTFEGKEQVESSNSE
ncbi:hypothetical protein H7X64_04895 [Armatimonadetes bacterium]|nr:hypothetical protein [bacterium]